MDEEAISEMLEALSDAQTARKANKHTHSLRGIRGCPQGEVARVGDAVWREYQPTLPADADALDRLFGTAWEDGLVAIGLLAAAAPDAPHAALDIGADWLERTDDVQSADALGWLVLGPALLAAQQEVDALLKRFRNHSRPAVRRAMVTMGLAFTPAKLEGSAAAPLRARLNTKDVRFVEDAIEAGLVRIANAFVKDEAAEVRKGLRRLLREWGRSDPEAVVRWADTVKGGLPKILRAEVKRAARRVQS